MDNKDNNETQANILAEMRNRADTVIEGHVITERKFVLQERVEDWADRLEAAAKREKAKEKNKRYEKYLELKKEFEGKEQYNAD